MSANNGILIDNETFKVYYQGCWDNGMNNAEKIGTGKNLDDAYKIAKKWLNDDELGFDLEYGIQII